MRGLLVGWMMMGVSLLFALLLLDGLVQRLFAGRCVHHSGVFERSHHLTIWGELKEREINRTL